MERTIAQYLAHEAKSLTFRELPAEVVKQAKRSLLDTLGMGFGGSTCEPARIVENLAKSMHGPAESTVLGSGRKVSCLYATLANGVMVRYLNLFDRGFLSKTSLGPAGSNCEAIPGILAVGERQHASGPEIITSIVLAYEQLNKVFDAMGGNNSILDKRGWTHETMRTPCVMALVAGRLLGLNEDEIANALSIAGCFNLELRILNSGENELTMARNLRFPYGAFGGIHGALFAQQGFKGPLDVFESRHGINEVVAGGAMNLEKLTQPRTDWTILYTEMSNIGVGVHMHGVIEAALNLAKEHGVKAEDIEAVKITTNSTTRRILANPETRRYPKNKETADHSVYYCTAVAILDRTIGLEQFTQDKLGDPKVKQLMDKIVIEPDPALDKFYNPGIVEISMRTGQTFKHEVLYPKGNRMNPMTDSDVERKFVGLTRKVIDEKQTQQIINTVYSMDKLSDIGDLTRLLVFSSQRQPTTGA